MPSSEVPMSNLGHPRLRHARISGWAVTWAHCTRNTPLHKWVSCGFCGMVLYIKRVLAPAQVRSSKSQRNPHHCAFCKGDQKERQKKATSKTIT